MAKNKHTHSQSSTITFAVHVLNNLADLSVCVHKCDTITNKVKFPTTLQCMR